MTTGRPAASARDGLARLAPVQPIEVQAGIRTARMVLRPLTGADQGPYLESVAATRGDLDRFLPLHREGETDERMFERQLRTVQGEQAAGRCFRCVGVMDDGRIAGGFHLNAISRGLEWQADVTWWVARDLTGRGLATEGVQGLLAHAFRDVPEGLGLHRVNAWITPDNMASIRVAARAGLLRQADASSYLQAGERWTLHEPYSRRV